MGGLLGGFEGRGRRRRAGASCASARARACSSSCLAWIIARFYGLVAGRPGAPWAGPTAVRPAGRPRRRHHAPPMPMPWPPCPPCPPLPPATDPGLPGAAARSASTASWPAGRGRHQRGLPGPRRVPRRDVAIKRVRPGPAGRLARGHALPARFFAAEAALVGGCTTRTWCRSSTPWPTRGALPGDGVRARRDAAALLPRRPLLPLEQIVEIGFKCAMALGYVLPPGPDPPRREAGQPAGGDGRRPGHRRQDHRLRQRASTRRPTARRSTASARWPTCRPSSSTATRWTAAPTSTRWRRCCTT
jgi:hypothetical protein